MAKDQPDQPVGITGPDALTRCLTILDKTENDDGMDETRQRVIRALAAFYDVTLPAHPDDQDPNR